MHTCKGRRARKEDGLLSASGIKAQKQGSLVRLDDALQLATDKWLQFASHAGKCEAIERNLLWAVQSAMDGTRQDSIGGRDTSAFKNVF